MNNILLFILDTKMSSIVEKIDSRDQSISLNHIVKDTNSKEKDLNKNIIISDADILKCVNEKKDTISLSKHNNSKYNYWITDSTYYTLWYYLVFTNFFLLFLHFVNVL